MPFLRFIILQVVLASGLVAAWMAGGADHAFAGHNRWGISAVLCVALIGLILTAFKNLTAAARIRDYLPIVAVIGMQLSLLPALAILADALMTGDPAKSAGAFIAALGTALYVSVTALCSYVWLGLTLWLCHDE